MTLAPHLGLFHILNALSPSSLHRSSRTTTWNACNHYHVFCVQKKQHKKRINYLNLVLVSLNCSIKVFSNNSFVIPILTNQFSQNIIWFFYKLVFMHWCGHVFNLGNYIGVTYFADSWAFIPSLPTLCASRASTLALDHNKPGCAYARST